MGIFDRLLGKKSPEQAMADKIGKAGDNKIYVYEANNPDNPNGWALATKEQAMAALKNDPSSVAIVQGYSKFRKGEKHIPGVPSTRGGYKIDYIAPDGQMSQIKAGALFDIKEPPQFDKTTALTVNKEQSGTPPAQESQAATREISVQPSKPSVTERNPNGTLTDAAVAAAREQLAGLTVSGSAKNGNTPQPGTQIGRITEAFVTEVNRLTANLPGGSKASIQETSTGLSARIAPPPGVAAQKAPVRDR